MILTLPPTAVTDGSLFSPERYLWERPGALIDSWKNSLEQRKNIIFHIWNMLIEYAEFESELKNNSLTTSEHLLTTG